jgi:hypothetical protein
MQTRPLTRAPHVPPSPSHTRRYPEAPCGCVTPTKSKRADHEETLLRRSRLHVCALQLCPTRSTGQLSALSSSPSCHQPRHPFQPGLGFRFGFSSCHQPQHPLQPAPDSMAPPHVSGPTPADESTAPMIFPSLFAPLLPRPATCHPLFFTHTTHTHTHHTLQLSFTTSFQHSSIDLPINRLAYTGAAAAQTHAVLS